MKAQLLNLHFLVATYRDEFWMRLAQSPEEPLVYLELLRATAELGRFMCVGVAESAAAVEAFRDFTLSQMLADARDDFAEKLPLLVEQHRGAPFVEFSQEQQCFLRHQVVCFGNARAAAASAKAELPHGEQPAARLAEFARALEALMADFERLQREYKAAL